LLAIYSFNFMIIFPELNDLFGYDILRNIFTNCANFCTISNRQNIY
jgi:hypothetical protein